MNEKFFALPIEKQEAIINAGYRVFSQNSYKKSPMSEIAAEAGISKSLLFHYFHNKLDFYLFLWENSANITMRYMEEFKCYEKKDLFEMLFSGMQAKLHIMKKYPHMGNFTIKAFYEKEPEIKAVIHKSYEMHRNRKAKVELADMDPEQFIPGIDMQMMYREMYLASEGYLWEMLQHGEIDVEKMEADFTKLIEFWKLVYLRKEG